LTSGTILGKIEESDVHGMVSLRSFSGEIHYGVNSHDRTLEASGCAVESV